MKAMKARYFLLAILLVCCPIFAGCGGGGGEDESEMFVYSKRIALMKGEEGSTERYELPIVDNPHRPNEYLASYGDTIYPTIVNIVSKGGSAQTIEKAQLSRGPDNKINFMIVGIDSGKTTELEEGQPWNPVPGFYCVDAYIYLNDVDKEPALRAYVTVPYPN